MKKNNILFFLFATVMIVLASCGGDEDDDTIAPKPRAYFRLSFPEKAYVQYDSSCPFSFEIPQYASISKDPNALAEPCWINVDYKQFNGTLHLSYKEVKGNVNGYLDDTYELASKHQVKATSQTERVVKLPNGKKAVVIEVEGEVPSHFQFYATDTSQHYLRGAVYLNVATLNDSLSPVVDYLKKDSYRILETLKWNK